MATWNKKQKAAMAAFQAKKPATKRQVFCRQCDRIHNHPVCKTAAIVCDIATTIAVAANAGAA